MGVGRLRDLPFQVDLWLPDGSDFLYVGARIRNPHERQVPTYWWSNIAVPEDCRVLAPAEEAYHFGYEQRLRRVPVPEYDGADRTYPPNSTYAADYFYEVPEARRRWIAALDADGHGLVQTSTDTLRGRKLFVWGRGPGGRSWQQWLTEPGTAGYCEIQAGLARTQLEHVRLEPESEVSWLEAYGPFEAPREGEWGAVLDEAETRLEGVLPRADVEAAYAAWLPCADTEPGGGWPPGPAGAPSKCSAPGGSCPARPSTSPPWATSRSRGCVCCAPVPSRAVRRPAAGRDAGGPALAGHAGDGARDRSHRVPPGRRPVARRRPGAGRAQLGARAGAAGPVLAGAALPRRRRPGGTPPRARRRPLCAGLRRRVP